MIKLRIFVFFNLICQFLKAQNCDCYENFIAITKCIEENYAGYFDKVNSKNIISYNKTKSSLLAESKHQQLNYNCIELLFEYLLFFNDPHISLQNITTDPKSRHFWRTIFSDVYKSTTHEKSPNKENPGKKKDLEGLWINEAGNLKVVIRKKVNNEFEGILVNPDSIMWFPDQVKFILNPKNKEAFFFNTFHIPRKTTFSIYDSIISFERYGRFYKKTELTGLEEKKSLFKATSVNDSTFYVKLGSFREQYFKLIDSLIISNSPVIKSSKYLIVDLVDNTGGSTLAYSKLFNYFIDDHYLRYGSKLRPSVANSEYYEKTSNDTLYSESVRGMIRELAKKMRDSSKQDYINFNSDATVKNKDSVISGKRVFFLVNGRTGSAAEVLLQIAEQSKRCTIIGQKTAGLIDYGNVNPGFDLPCPYIKLAYPTGRSNINDLKGHKSNEGIFPDIVLNSSNDKWLNYIIQNLIIPESPKE